MSGRPPAPSARRSPLLRTCVRLVFHPVLATSVFFLVSGHNAPGGGFVAGLVAGTAFVLRYLAGVETAAGASGPGRAAPEGLRPATALGAGLLLAGCTAVAPWVGGGQLLESGYTYADVPVLGEVPLASVLAFDTGVYLVVVGMVLGVLSTLGAQADTSLAGEEEVPG